MAEPLRVQGRVDTAAGATRVCRLAWLGGLWVPLEELRACALPRGPPQVESGEPWLFGFLHLHRTTGAAEEAPRLQCARAPTFCALPPRPPSILDPPVQCIRVPTQPQSTARRAVFCGERARKERLSWLPPEGLHGLHHSAKLWLSILADDAPGPAAGYFLFVGVSAAAVLARAQTWAPGRAL